MSHATMISRMKKMIRMTAMVMLRCIVVVGGDQLLGDAVGISRKKTDSVGVWITSVWDKDRIATQDRSLFAAETAFVFRR
ncbi:hypothetical protein BDW69DRAFT_160529 [Aspergillus filifer]